jgi:hypothetical protein
VTRAAITAGDALSVIQRVAQRVLDHWDPDRELKLGIDALLHGFERLLP